MNQAQFRSNLLQAQFRSNLLIVIGIYLLTIVTGVVLRWSFPDEKSLIYPTFKDLVPLFIAIPAAWLAYCFQRRQAYLKDMRDLWSKIVVAIQEAFQYTHLSKPEQSDYGRILKSLSIVIDEMRAAFANVGEKRSQVGLFPFESIKTIHDKISALRYGSDFDPKKPLLQDGRSLSYGRSFVNTFSTS